MKPELIRSGDLALLLRFGSEISDEMARQVWSAFDRISRWAHPAVRNLHPAYASLLVELSPGHGSVDDFAAALKSELESEVEREPRDAIDLGGKLHEIPVRYGGADGPDLAAVGSARKLSEEAVIALHTSREYRVYFVGFRPGFAYLGTLPEVLRVPRLATPRRKVPAGSVAIAEAQTGIYPLDSPGGWHVLGRTSLELFMPSKFPPVRLQMGDRVRFRAVRAGEPA